MRGGDLAVLFEFEQVALGLPGGYVREVRQLVARGRLRAVPRTDEQQQDERVAALLRLTASLYDGVHALLTPVTTTLLK